MILARLENSHLYRNTHPLFGKAFDFLNRTDLKDLPLGKTAIEDDRLFAIVGKDQGRTLSGTTLEVHRKYIDIQFCLNGVDYIGYKPTVDCVTPAAEYLEEKDIAFYKDPSDFFFPLPPGVFSVLYPEDGHAPLGGEGILHKVVLKIKL